MTVWLAAIFLFLISVSPARAARSINISSDKAQIVGLEEMSIQATISGFASDEAIFIKGAFFKEGETNYFGYTKSGDNWIKNSANTQSQRQVILGQWDNSLVVKSDYDDTGFGGNGNYKFKVGFYYQNSSGSLSSVNWSENILSVSLRAPDPTPTPAPTSVPTPTVLPTPKATAPPQKTAEPTPIFTSSSPANSPEPDYTNQDESGEVLGIESLPTPDSETKIATSPKQQKRGIFLPAITLISLGVIFIGVSIYTALKTSKSTLNVK